MPQNSKRNLVQKVRQTFDNNRTGRHSTIVAFELITQQPQHSHNNPICLFERNALRKIDFS